MSVQILRSANSLGQARMNCTSTKRGQIAAIKMTCNRFSVDGTYSFNVQVDITQLQTDREARKEDRAIARAHSVHLMNVERRQVAADPRPSQMT